MCIRDRILEVNAEKKRISLSIRALLQEEKPVAAEEEQSSGRGRRDDEERFSYTIPPVEEATTSLADLFKKLDD